MTDKEIYEQLWEAYTDADALDFLKDYINESIKYIDKNKHVKYDQLYFKREDLEILLKELESL
jgi:hypothetical protein